jgi:hypothetical protein
MQSSPSLRRRPECVAARVWKQRQHLRSQIAAMAWNARKRNGRGFLGDHKCGIAATAGGGGADIRCSAGLII